MWPKELQGKGTGKINIHLLHVLYFSLILVPPWLLEPIFKKISFQHSSLKSSSQGSQIRQIWRILCQNCSDDSTEVTEGVTSTPEIFGNKHSFVVTFFKLKNYTARQNRKRVNYDQSLLDDRHHGFESFELSRWADRHSYFVYPTCIQTRITCWKVWKWLFLLWYLTPNIPKWLQNLWSRSHSDSTHQ